MSSMVYELRAFARTLAKSGEKQKIFLEKEYQRNENIYSDNGFHYYKAIFIHIPKAAGNSIAKKLFGTYGGGHRTIESYIKAYGSIAVKLYFTFTFVRNPWDRLYSAYTFLRKGGMNESDADFALKNLNHLHSFEEFIMNWLTDETIYSYYHFIPQYKFITREDNPDKIVIDFVGRFENINDDFVYICKKLKIENTSLPHINNTSNSTSYKDVYTQQMIEKVSNLYQKDIDLFAYKFK